MPLGYPSDRMKDSQRAAWELSRREVPWLMESDRVLVEIASYPRADNGRRGGGRRSAEPVAHVYGSDGRYPGRSVKIAMPDKPDGDPADAYFQ